MKYNDKMRRRTRHGAGRGDDQSLSNTGGDPSKNLGLAADSGTPSLHVRLRPQRSIHGFSPTQLLLRFAKLNRESPDQDLARLVQTLQVLSQSPCRGIIAPLREPSRKDG